MRFYGFLFGIILMAAVSSPGMLEAKMYKWKDEKGVLHFSNSPPVGAVQSKKVYETSLPSTINQTSSFDRAAREVLKSSVVSFESYYVNNGDSYDGVTFEILVSLGLVLKDEVTVTVISATKESYNIEASNDLSDTIYFIIGPNPEIRKKKK